MVDWKKWAVFGAIAGAGLPYVLKLVGMIPGLSVTQATVTASIPVATVNTGLGTWALSTLGITSLGPITASAVLMTAFGGALSFVVGAYIVNTLGLLKGSDVERVAWVTAISGAATGWILSGTLGIPTLGAVILTAVGSLVTGWLLVKLLETIGLKNLIP